MSYSKTFIRLFTLIVLTICLTFNLALSAEDFGLPKTVTILGNNLSLKDQVNNEEKGFIAEFIHADKTWENWDFMFAVRFIPGNDLDPIASAQATASNIEALKATDPVAHYSTFLNNDKTEAMVDFLISNAKQDMFEHNVWRFLKAKNGIVAYQIARRIFVTKDNTKEVEKFIKDISDIREKIFNEINRPNLPLPNLVK